MVLVEPKKIKGKEKEGEKVKNCEKIGGNKLTYLKKRTTLKLRQFRNIFWLNQHSIKNRTKKGL